MRTFLAVIGALALLFVVAVVGLFIVGWRSMAPLKKEAVRYVDEALPAIVGGWSGEALLAHATPEFQNALTADRVEDLMMSGTLQFGPLTKYAGADCKIVHVEMNTASGQVAIAECAAAASFARLEAAIRVNALKRAGEWKLFAFFVEPVGEGAPIQRTAHLQKIDNLSVFKASIADGFIAASAPGASTTIAASVAGREAVHVDP
jgi:hypothetical protein